MLKNAAGADSVLRHIAGRHIDTAVPCHVDTDRQSGQLVGDSLEHFQPVEVTQKQSDMVETPRSIDQSSCSSSVFSVLAVLLRCHEERLARKAFC